MFVLFVTCWKRELNTHTFTHSHTYTHTHTQYINVNILINRRGSLHIVGVLFLFFSHNKNTNIMVDIKSKKPTVAVIGTGFVIDLMVGLIIF